MTHDAVSGNDEIYRLTKRIQELERQLEDAREQNTRDIRLAFKQLEQAGKEIARDRLFLIATQALKEEAESEAQKLRTVLELLKTIIDYELPEGEVGE